MNFGMTKEQFSLLNELVITPLKKKNLRVFIFGSRVTGKHHSHSDVDLLYKSDSKVILPSGFLSQIKESIEESRFPFTIDLVAEEDLVSSYKQSVVSSMVEL